MLVPAYAPRPVSRQVGAACRCGAPFVFVSHGSGAGTRQRSTQSAIGMLEGRGRRGRCLDCALMSDTFFARRGAAAQEQHECLHAVPASSSRQTVPKRWHTTREEPSAPSALSLPAMNDLCVPAPAFRTWSPRGVLSASACSCAPVLPRRGAAKMLQARERAYAQIPCVAFRNRY